MMRRIPYTPLVCLIFLTATIFAGPAWAAPIVDTAENSLAKSQVIPQSAMGDLKPKAIVKVKPPTPFPTCAYPFVSPEITKVRPDYMHRYATEPQFALQVLPAPRVGRWDMSVGVLFARLRGKIAWPRYPQAGTYYGYGAGGTYATDFTDGLQLPGHLAVPTWSIKYVFRQNWAFRYSGLAFEANGGGQPTDYFNFGPSQQYYGSYGYGTGIQTKYQHAYHRVGLLYDAVKNYRSSVGVFADWVHGEDKISVISSISTGQISVFSKGTDAAIAGIEFQRLMKATSNGAIFSCDFKAGGIFLDDVEGWDAQAGAHYAIPLNSGRSGYVKAGYRLVQLKKGQSDFLLTRTLEGGFMEFGLIF